MFVYLIDNAGNVQVSRQRLDIRAIDYLEFRPQDSRDVEDYYNFISEYLPRPLNKSKHWDEYTWRFRDRKAATENYSLTDDENNDDSFSNDYLGNGVVESSSSDDDDEMYRW